MKCPVCGVWVMVKETRKKTELETKRRYECANEHRFYTLETICRVLETPKKRRYRE
jgi:transcriptional regulator NrdR family protein